VSLFDQVNYAEMSLVGHSHFMFYQVNYVEMCLSRHTHRKLIDFQAGALNICCLIGHLDIACETITDWTMTMDPHEIAKKVDAFLVNHPNVSLYLLADKFGVTRKAIEEALYEAEGVSFRQFKDARRLAVAFKQLGAVSPATDGPYEKMRVRRRVAIPRAVVRYRMHFFWKSNGAFSGWCPLVDFSGDGVALLADEILKNNKRISLLLKYSDGDETLRVEGRVIYSVATGIAGYRYRIGVKFVPFNGRRGGNPSHLRDVLIAMEKAFSS
jgi:AraC-like DNA-binding protein